MALNTIEDIFEAFNGLKVLIIGDMMIDSYIYGNVSRISPEAPVPVLQITQKEERLGGAANVARNVQALGAKVTVSSVIGSDAEAGLLEQLLAKRGISGEGLVKSKERITTVKNRVMSGSQHMMRIDNESQQALNKEERTLLLNRIKQIAMDVNLIIFQDYDKGTIDEIVIRETTKYARAIGIPTVVDPKKKNFMHYKECTLFKPNLKELKEGLKVDFDGANEQDLSRAVNILKEKLQSESVLVTLSEKGVMGANGVDEFLLPAHVRTISDVSGAGDTVISIAGLCIALGLPLKFAAALSNLGGGLVCEHLGVVPVDKTRLMEEGQKHDVISLLE